MQKYVSKHKSEIENSFILLWIAYFCVGKSLLFDRLLWKNMNIFQRNFLYSRVLRFISNCLTFSIIHHHLLLLSWKFFDKLIFNPSFCAEYRALMRLYYLSLYFLSLIHLSTYSLITTFLLLMIYIIDIITRLARLNPMPVSNAPFCT